MIIFKLKYLHDLRKKYGNELGMGKKYYVATTLSDIKSCENVLCSVLSLHKDPFVATAKAHS